MWQREKNSRKAEEKRFKSPRSLRKFTFVVFIRWCRFFVLAVVLPFVVAIAEKYGFLEQENKKGKFLNFPLLLSFTPFHFSSFAHIVLHLKKLHFHFRSHFTSCILQRKMGGKLCGSLFSSITCFSYLLAWLLFCSLILLTSWYFYSDIKRRWW